MGQSDTPNEVRSSDRLGLLPEREGQPRTLTMALPWEYERGHWYSPAAVREMLAAERELCAKLCDAQFWIVSRSRGGDAAVAAGECAAEIRGA